MHKLVPIVLTLCAGINAAMAQDDEETPFYLTLDAPPAPELSPEEALDSFRVAAGFRVELVASEPLVEDPVQIVWDEDGRLYVVEMRGYMPDAYGNGEDEPVGAVVRLTDTDGDGRMDTREVLADALVLPRAVSVIPEGMLIAEPPNLWLCPGELNRADTIDCSNKVSLGEYGNQPGSVEHAENMLLLAMDNWIYSAKSDRKFQIENGELVIEPTVFRGQWGLGQDDDGFLYYNGNSNLVTGDLYPDHDVSQAGVTPTPGLSTRFHRNDEVFSVRINPGVNRAYLDGVLRQDGRLRSPTAASGVEIYRGDQFPDSHYGTAFIPESAGNLVAQVRINRDDLSVSTEHINYADPDWGRRDFFASTDERFRPVETRTGPDGALYVVDMYRGIIQDHIFLSDELRAQVFERGLDVPLGMGRIWRIVHEDNPIDYYSPGDFSQSTSDLVGYLSEKNAWWRNMAQRVLVASEASDINAAMEELVESSESQAAIHALWILEGRDALSSSLIQDIIERGDDRFALHAIRAGCDLLSDSYLLDQLYTSSDLNQSTHLAMRLCLRRHYSEEVLDYITTSFDDFLPDPYSRVAMQTMLQNREVELIEHIVGSYQNIDVAGNEGETAAGGTAVGETAVGETIEAFTRALVVQAINSDNRNLDQITRLLDLVTESAEGAWHKDSLLAGLYEASHINEFERVMLDAPHPLFSVSNASVAMQMKIADARSSFTWAGDDLGADQKPLDPETQLLAERGEQLFTAQCSGCHGADGAGITGLAPSLLGSDRIVRAPEQLIRIVLHGLSGPIDVQGEQWNNLMPGHSEVAGFDDEGISGLVTWLRRSWGHNRSPISPQAVAEIRAENQERMIPWTDEELSTVPINKRYEAFVGRFGGQEYSYNGSELEVTASIFSGPMEEIGEDVFLFEPRNIIIEFDRIVDGRAEAVWVSTDTGKRRVPRREN